MEKRKDHWENVYETKDDQEVSWYQEIPVTSLDLINSLSLYREDSIIDIGRGNSNLVSELYKKGFTNLLVLDISSKSLERTKSKLGRKSTEIQLIVSDILEFQPSQKYSLWHDRAIFHFLINEMDISQYVNIVSKAIKKEGYLIIATFSTSGRKKCSGLEITQYSKEKLQSLFHESFELVQSLEDVHKTSFETEQNFIYTIFKRK
ncbi:MAG: SAM-dependent methyltransferase [Flavobacteriaceae bacterium TMED48]|nr:MAG: SAM-dependent methyltransferase [Flavobacteriaceae bacterium TMED48]